MGGLHVLQEKTNVTNFTKNNHCRGAAAVHALSSELLLLGYNVAFPHLDRSSGDDLISICPRTKRATRIQVRSRHVTLLNGRPTTKSATIKIPQSLVTSEGTADVVCIAIRLAEAGSWHLGLLGRKVIGSLSLAGKGSLIKKAKYASEGTIDYRFHLQVEDGRLKSFSLAGSDVTSAFHPERTEWLPLLSR